MTTEERLEIIRNKAERNVIEAEEKANAEELKREELKSQIKNLYSRIQSLLICANECVKNGIKIPKSDSTYSRAGEKYGYDHEFIAEGFYHGTGLVRERDSKTFRYLGINNGGACGPWDFRTDGDIIINVGGENYNRDQIKEPQNKDMEKFLKQFPIFEEAFYKWIDSMDC